MLFRPPRKRLPAHKASWEKKASCSPVNEIRGANSSRGRVGSPFRLARPRSASPCRRTCEPCLFISLPIFPFLFRSQRWKCPLRERPALHRFFLFDGVPRPGARGPDPQHHANLRRPPPSAAFFYRATSPQGSRLPLPPRGRRRGTGSSSCPWASWGLGAEVGLGLPGAHACPDPRRPAQRGEGDVESRGAAPLRPGAVPRGWAWPRGGPPPRHAPARGHVTRVGAGARWARPGARVRARGRWRCCCSRPPRVGPAPSPRCARAARARRGAALPWPGCARSGPASCCGDAAAWTRRACWGWTWAAATGQACAPGSRTPAPPWSST